MNTTTELSSRSISQETTAVLSVGATLLAACIALAGLMLVTTGRIVDEGRVERQALRSEARADREHWRAQINATREEWRAEVRAFREEWQAEVRAFRAEAQADRIAFARQIARLTEHQSRLNGLVEGSRERMTAPGAPSAPEG